MYKKLSWKHLSDFNSKKFTWFFQQNIFRYLIFALLIVYKSNIHSTLHFSNFISRRVISPSNRFHSWSVFYDFRSLDITGQRKEGGRGRGEGRVSRAEQGTGQWRKVKGKKWRGRIVEQESEIMNKRVRIAMLDCVECELFIWIRALATLLPLS